MPDFVRLEFKYLQFAQPTHTIDNRNVEMTFRTYDKVFSLGRQKRRKKIAYRSALSYASCLDIANLFDRNADPGDIGPSSQPLASKPLSKSTRNAMDGDI